MINVGLIGFGYWGPNVARNLHENSGIKLKWICDKDKERLDKAKNIYVSETEYTDNYKDILDDSDVEVVAVALGTSAHFKFTKEALLSGKHVYVEKPFTSTVKEAEELKKLSIDLGLKIHVNHIMVYHPIINKIKDLVDSNEIGDILYIDAMRMNLGQIRNDVSAMWDLAVHDLTIIDFITNGAEPKHISAMGEKFYNPKESLCFLNIKYPSFISHIQSSWISPLKERKLIIAGTKKMIVFDDMKSSEKLMVYDKGVDIVSGKGVEYDDYAVKTREGDIWIPFIEQEDALYNSIESLRLSILNDAEIKTDPDQAIRIQKILEEADSSMTYQDKS